MALSSQSQRRKHVGMYSGGDRDGNVVWHCQKPAAVVAILVVEPLMGGTWPTSSATPTTHSAASSIGRSQRHRRCQAWAGLSSYDIEDVLHIECLLKILKQAQEQT